MLFSINFSLQMMKKVEEHLEAEKQWNAEKEKVARLVLR
jgi:hypothetical protein